MNSPQPVNPYIAGSPVTGTEMFFGRQDVFTFIRRNLIGRHRDSSVVIYGQRRTGKTSVLYQLHRYLDDGYWCVFVDMHGLNLNGMGNLMLGITAAISRDLRREHGISLDMPDRASFEADPRHAFETLFLDRAWSVLGDDRHLVLMLDEAIRLEEEVQAGRLDRDVFDYLRHLMQHHARLNFIFSLGSGVEEMAKQYALLFSVSLYRRISFLEPAAARDLIMQPARDQYDVTPAGVTKILAITSGHPYYTQLLCQCMFDSWARDPRPLLDVDDIEQVLPDAIERGSANLTYVWEDSTPAEQAVMAALAAALRRRDVPATAGDVLEIWREAGVVIPEGEIMRAVRSLISREVLAGTEAYRFTVDLQRRWLDMHRRVDWVKDELAQALRERSPAGELPPGQAVRDAEETPGATVRSEPEAPDGPKPGTPDGSTTPDPHEARVGEPRATATLPPGPAVRRPSTTRKLAISLAGVGATVIATFLVVQLVSGIPGFFRSLVNSSPTPSFSIEVVPSQESSSATSPSPHVSIGSGVSQYPFSFDIEVQPSQVRDAATRTPAVEEMVQDLNAQLIAKNLHGKKAAIVEVFASGPVSGVGQAVQTASLAFARMKALDPVLSAAAGQSFWQAGTGGFKLVIYFYK